MSVAVPPLIAEPRAVIAAQPSERRIGSLWRRIAAFVVDAVLLGLAGSVVALPFFGPLSQLGPWGPLAGSFLALPYFAVLNSRIGNGQTLGKRWLRLQVVDKDGKTISLERSAVRYALFAVPYFANGIGLPITKVPEFFSIALYVAVFGAGGATFYLVCFNRHTRQGVHDLVVGSYVAEAEKSGAPRIQAIWKLHWVILASVFIVAGAAMAALWKKPASPFPELLEDVRLVESMPQVYSATAQEVNPWGGSGRKKILVINAHWGGKPGGEKAFADEVAKKILQHDSKAESHDLLRVLITRGYDLGIANAHLSYRFEHSPAEWNQPPAGTSLQEQFAPPKPE